MFKFSKLFASLTPEASRTPRRKPGVQLRLEALEAREMLSRSTWLAPAASAPVSSPPGTYAVRAGDSLWNISQKVLGNGKEWQKLYSLNQSVIGSDPNLLQVGEVLNLPGSAGTAPAATQAPLPAGSMTLTPGQGVWSANGAYCLTLQTDGNLVLYTAGGQALWATGTNGQKVQAALMQTDGNLVVYAPNKPDGSLHPLWASNTYGNSGARLAVQNDGNLVIYTAQGTPIWASNTAAYQGASSSVHRYGNQGGNHGFGNQGYGGQPGRNQGSGNQGYRNQDSGGMDSSGSQPQESQAGVDAGIAISDIGSFDVNGNQGNDNQGYNATAGFHPNPVSSFGEGGQAAINAAEATTLTFSGGSSESLYAQEYDGIYVSGIGSFNLESTPGVQIGNPLPSQDGPQKPRTGLPPDGNAFDGGGGRGGLPSGDIPGEDDPFGHEDPCM
jgi:hypothetical protein